MQFSIKIRRLSVSKDTENVFVFWFFKKNIHISCQICGKMLFSQKNEH